MHKGSDSREGRFACLKAEGSPTRDQPPDAVQGPAWRCARVGDRFLIDPRSCQAVWCKSLNKPEERFSTLGLGPSVWGGQGEKSVSCVANSIHVLPGPKLCTSVPPRIFALGMARLYHISPQHSPQATPSPSAPHQNLAGKERGKPSGLWCASQHALLSPHSASGGPCLKSPWLSVNATLNAGLLLL